GGGPRAVVALWLLCLVRVFVRVHVASLLSNAVRGLLSVDAATAKNHCAHRQEICWEPSSTSLQNRQPSRWLYGPLGPVFYLLRWWTNHRPHLAAASISQPGEQTYRGNPENESGNP
ncbi:MAG: hypothetical protein AB7L09_26315, partial [Nitrospira sp.]